MTGRARKVKMTVTLTSEQLADLRSVAEAHGSTLSALVVRGIALQRFLLQQGSDSQLFVKRGRRVRQVVTL